MHITRLLFCVALAIFGSIGPPAVLPLARPQNPPVPRRPNRRAPASQLLRDVPGQPRCGTRHAEESALERDQRYGWTEPRSRGWIDRTHVESGNSVIRFSGASGSGDTIKDTTVDVNGHTDDAIDVAGSLKAPYVLSPDVFLLHDRIKGINTDQYHNHGDIFQPQGSIGRL